MTQEIRLHNWHIQRATGYPRECEAPLMLCGFDYKTDEWMTFQMSYIKAVSGCRLRYYDLTDPSIPTEQLQGDILLSLLDPSPEYLRYIRRSCLETWDPLNPIKLKGIK